jgi:hypothetical protein
MDKRDAAIAARDERQARVAAEASSMVKCGLLMKGDMFRTTYNLKTIECKVKEKTTKFGEVPCVTTAGDRIHIKSQKLVRKIK